MGETEVIEGNERLVYSVDEVSKMLSISRNLTYKLCREKKIPCIHLGNKRMLCPARAIDHLLSGEGTTPPTKQP